MNDRLFQCDVFSFRLVPCGYAKLQMTTEEQFQSPDILEINGTEDGDAHEDEEQLTTSATSEPPARRSRFFRSRRKQRLNEDPSNQAENHTNETNESSESSESPRKMIKASSWINTIFSMFVEQQVEETPTEEHSEIDVPIAPTVRKRSSSPPPPPLSDGDDELDGSSTSEPIQFSLSTENPDVERQTHLARNDTEEKASATQPRPSASTIYTGYQRKKSQSVKLTRLEPIDAYPKKNVRFADDFGLDLSQIKMIKSDELPHVPSAAFKDLNIDDEQSGNNQQERMKTITYLEQRFENPIHAHGFDDRVSRHKIVLEQASK